MDKKYLRVLYILLGCTLLFIWGNSLLPASVSGSISAFIKELLSRLLGFMEDTEGDGLLRKLAHGLEFAALGAELLLLGREKKWPRSGILLGGLGVSLMDETIQLFVEGRNGAIRDVWIDMGGFFFGIMVCLVVVKSFPWGKGDHHSGSHQNPT